MRYAQSTSMVISGRRRRRTRRRRRLPVRIAVKKKKKKRRRRRRRRRPPVRIAVKKKMKKKKKKKKAVITQLQVLTINNTHRVQKEVKKRTEKDKYLNDGIHKPTRNCNVCLAQNGGNICMSM